MKCQAPVVVVIEMCIRDSEYTDWVGKPGMPPLWSFGTWMSRITYFSAKEGYDVAANIRKNKYPCDVIPVSYTHLECR